MRVLNLEEMLQVSGGCGHKRSVKSFCGSKGSGKGSGHGHHGHHGGCGGKGSHKSSGKGSGCTPPPVCTPPVDVPTDPGQVN